MCMPHITGCVQTERWLHPSWSRQHTVSLELSRSYSCSYYSLAREYQICQIIKQSSQKCSRHSVHDSFPDFCSAVASSFHAQGLCWSKPLFPSQATAPAHSRKLHSNKQKLEHNAIFRKKVYTSTVRKIPMQGKHQKTPHEPEELVDGPMYLMCPYAWDNDGLLEIFKNLCLTKDGEDRKGAKISSHTQPGLKEGKMSAVSTEELEGKNTSCVPPLSGCVSFCVSSLPLLRIWNRYAFSTCVESKCKNFENN